jgi:hypothetical protein
LRGFDKGRRKVVKLAREVGDRRRKRGVYPFISFFMGFSLKIIIL